MSEAVVTIEQLSETYSQIVFFWRLENLHELPAWVMGRNVEFGFDLISRSRRGTDDLMVTKDWGMMIHATLTY